MGDWVCMCDLEDFPEVESDVIGCTYEKFKWYEQEHVFAKFNCLEA